MIGEGGGPGGAGGAGGAEGAGGGEGNGGGGGAGEGEEPPIPLVQHRGAVVVARSCEGDVVVEVGILLVDPGGNSFRLRTLDP